MMTRRKQLRAAKKAGATVTRVKATGEVRVEFGPGRPTIRMNNRRKDGTREVQKHLDRLEDQP